MSKTQVGIIMGSQSDMPVMSQAGEILEKFSIGFETQIISAHRAPDILFEYMQNARNRGLKVIIAGAGGAAHLPGVAAGLTTLPVVGVPLRSRISIDGWDSVLSILQMPPGIPVATVALDGAMNAGILAAQIIGVDDTNVSSKLSDYKIELREKVIKANQPA